MEEIRNKGSERDILRNTCNQLNVYIHDTYDLTSRVKVEQENFVKENNFIDEQIKAIKESKR